MLWMPGAPALVSMITQVQSTTSKYNAITPAMVEEINDADDGDDYKAMCAKFWNAGNPSTWLVKESVGTGAEYVLLFQDPDEGAIAEIDSMTQLKTFVSNVLSWEVPPLLKISDPE